MDAPVRAGDILAQKYRVDRVLGVGGMGVVVAATHIELEQRVAVKFMLDEAFTNVESRSRFLREARAVVKLRSEHVARVLDTGTLENGAPYIVMEYLEGTDLAATLLAHGPMPLLLATECLVQACDALAEAHALGIVHRDLKPANLFIARRSDGAPLVKVLDFGISKVSALNDKSVAMTKTSALMGSPLYMSPEQMRSAKDVDQRTDVWSLGVVLYEMLSGKVPFMSESLGELLYAVMTLPHPPLATVINRQDIPPEVSSLVDWCLQKDPAQRAPNVAEIAHRLAPYCPSRSMSTVERISAVLRVAPPVGFTGTTTQDGLHRMSSPALPSYLPANPGSYPGANPGSYPGPLASSQPIALQVQGFPAPSSPSGVIAVPAPHAQTSAGWSGTHPGRARSSSRTPMLIGLGAGTLAAVAIGGLLVSRSLGPGNAGGTSTSAGLASPSASATGLSTPTSPLPQPPSPQPSLMATAQEVAAPSAAPAQPAQPSEPPSQQAVVAPSPPPAVVAPAHGRSPTRSGSAAHGTSSPAPVVTPAPAKAPSGGIPESSR